MYKDGVWDRILEVQNWRFWVDLVITAKPGVLAVSNLRYDLRIGGCVWHSCAERLSLKGDQQAAS